MHGQEISDNEIYLLIKYMKSVLWRVAKHLSYIEEARCLKVKKDIHCHHFGQHYDIYIYIYILVFTESLGYIFKCKIFAVSMAKISDFTLLLTVL